MNRENLNMSVFVAAIFVIVGFFVGYKQGSLEQQKLDAIVQHSLIVSNNEYQYSVVTSNAERQSHQMRQNVLFDLRAYEARRRAEELNQLQSTKPQPPTGGHR